MVSPLNSNSVESTLEIVVARLGDLKEQQAKDAIALASSIDGIRNEVRQMSVLYVVFRAGESGPGQVLPAVLTHGIVTDALMPKP